MIKKYGTRPPINPNNNEKPIPISSAPHFRIKQITKNKRTIPIFALIQGAEPTQPEPVASQPEHEIKL